MQQTQDEVQLFDATTIDQIDWSSVVPQAAEKFLPPLLKNGINAYINNVHGEVFALKVGSFVFPVIITDGMATNSYICSPHEHYFTYGQEAISLISNKYLAACVSKLLEGLEWMSRLGKIDSIVYVNHWLFSTDLYPEGLSQQHIDLLVAFLTQRFPNHAIIFRSLNQVSMERLMNDFQRSGFNLLASRYVFFTNTKNDALFRTRIIKSDLRLYHSGDYEICDEQQLSTEDCAELLKLYNTLYLQHHSERNPHYDIKFIRLLMEQQLLHFKVVKQGGTFKGMAGYYERDGVMMCPFFGYDKDADDHTVVYRLLSTSLLLEARKRGLLFHQSAGASFYKTVRRAEGCLEWMGIYTRHLPYRRQLSWSLLRLFINNIAPRYMKRY